jgi:hypothetical protein
MANQKITDLVQIETISSDDVLPIVDISDNITKKINITQIKAQSPVQSVNASTGDVTVQATLVSGTNIKTVNSTSLLGSGDVAVQATLVSGTSIKTVNSTSLLGSGDVAVQATLVSGTNIKTINSTSILGSGNLVVAAAPSGVSGSVQFSDGSALASDATNFFWDDTNNRLGVGINVPTSRLHIKGTGITSGTSSLNVTDSSANSILFIRDDGFVGIGTTGPTAALSITNNQNNSAGGLYNLDVRNLNADGQARINFKENSAGANRAYITWGNNENILRIATTGSANPIYFGIADAPKLVIQSSGNVGIGTLTPVSTAALDISSTTQGFLMPRMTTTQRDAIGTPATGLSIYNTTTNSVNYYNGTAWEDTKLVITNRQTASYTLAITDANKLVEVNNASANNLTIPLNSSVAFATGTQILLAQYGAGQTTVVATSGVTIRSSGGKLKLNAQYSGATLIKIATDEWYLFGDIAT